MASGYVGSDGAATLRDEVIAGLRERGWPEPETMMGKRFWYVDGDKRRSTGLCFDAEARDIVWTTADGLENGKIDYHVHAPASRIIEAIDRLRWVIGLPPVFFQKRCWFGVDVAEQPSKSAYSVHSGTKLIGGPYATEAEAKAAMRQILDEGAGLVPLPPSKPEPKPERPYEARKIGEL